MIFNCHSVRVVYGLEKLIFWIGYSQFNFFFFPKFCLPGQNYNHSTHFGIFSNIFFFRELFFCSCNFSSIWPPPFWGTIHPFFSGVLFFLFCFLLLQFLFYLATTVYAFQSAGCGTMCLWGGLWPKYYDFQSANGAFGLDSGLNIKTFNPH